MREQITTLNEWLKGAESVAVARVIQTWGSSPRPVGSMMVIDSNGKMNGSVSGGCVEGEVVSNALEMIKSKDVTKILEFGISDELAWSTGLSCGGKLTVLLQVIDSEEKVWGKIRDKLEEGSAVSFLTNLNSGETEIVNEVDDGDDYFVQSISAKSKLLIIGIAHVTVDLVRFAKMFDFETIVIDPRGFFSENTVFEVEPDQVHVKYPSDVLPNLSLDSSTYCAILSHDPKIDDNALEILLRTNVAYIGALGSRKNHMKRLDRLTKLGFSSDELDRIKGPIGLNIGAIGAREIGFSIMGQILATRNGLN